MRIAMTVLLALLLAWGLWLIVLDPDLAETPEHSPGAGPDAGGAARTLPPGRIRWGTLVLRVRAPDGSVPAGARVGYSYGGRERWAPVDAQGLRRFTDAPLGRFTAIARAPGFEDARRPCLVQAGLSEEVVLLLRAPEDPGGR